VHIVRREYGVKRYYDCNLYCRRDNRKDDNEHGVYWLPFKWSKSSIIIESVPDEGKICVATTHLCAAIVVLTVSGLKTVKNVTSARVVQMPASRNAENPNRSG
jgi:hypothetical protein